MTWCWSRSSLAVGARNRVSVGLEGNKGLMQKVEQRKSRLTIPDDFFVPARRARDKAQGMCSDE